MANERRNVEINTFIGYLEHSELKLFRNAEKSTIKLAICVLFEIIFKITENESIDLFC